MIDASSGSPDVVRDVCELVGSTLGPFGTNKLVVEASGTVTTTAAGSLLLERLDIDDPAVTLLAQAAADFQREYRDGSGTVVALTGALLERAEDLLEQDVHPTAIEAGYRTGCAAAVERLDAATLPTASVDLSAVAGSALTGVRDPLARARAGEFIERAASTLVDAHGDAALDRDRVRVVARLGARGETELVGGVILDLDPVTEGMPRRLENAGIGLLSSTVDVRRIGSETARTKGVSVSIEADSFDERAALGDWEREAFRETLEAAVDAGCRFIATRRAVNDRVKVVLANHGILAIQRVDEDAMDQLARLTGATVVPHLDGLTAETLGTAEVGVRREAGRDFVAVESTAGEPVYTLFVRAADPRAADAFERSAESALAGVRGALRGGGVVAGGGSTEVAAARAARDRGRRIDRRDALAVDAFADALEVLPRTLARNAGMDGLDALTRLRAAHDDGREAVGVDAFEGGLRDVLDDDPIVDPAATRRATWEAATELAVRLLRIDARLEATELEPEETGPPEE